MISTSEFRSGIAIKIDGQLYTIVEYQHFKPGKGGAFMRMKLRKMKDGSIVEKTCRAGTKFEDVFIEKRVLQYMYRAGDLFHMMDTKSYEQVELPADIIGPAAGFLKEEMEIEGQFYDGNIIGVSPPMFVDVLIKETDPGLRGDTAKGGTKPAVLETGATILVPLFVDPGDLVRVDTRKGIYVSRL